MYKNSKNKLIQIHRKKKCFYNKSVKLIELKYNIKNFNIIYKVDIKKRGKWKVHRCFYKYCEIFLIHLKD